MQRTGRLKGITDGDKVVGFFLVDMRKDKDFPDGITDIAMDVSMGRIVETCGWMGKRCKVEGFIYNDGSVNYISVVGIGLAKPKKD
jgi:hypothetical protein